MRIFGKTPMLSAMIYVCYFLALGSSDFRIDGSEAATIEQSCQAIIDEYQEAKRAYSVKSKAATTDEQRQAISADYPSPENYYGRLLALAKDRPNDPEAVDALAWIVATSTNGYDAFKSRGEQIKFAMGILSRDHLNDPKVGSVCLALAVGPAPLRDEFLHTIYAKSTDRRVKGRACLALGEFLLAKAATVSELRGPSGDELLRKLKTDFPHRLPYYQLLLHEEPGALTGQGEQLLEKAIAEYGDLSYDPVLRPSRRETLAEVGRSDLRRLRDLAVGRRAPEIEGRDVNGNPFKLSDYRGRVVLLTFSGNWCGPCLAMYPDERAIVERFKDKPFALLSVNTDHDRETLRKSISQGEITWRCWWESDTDGPICSKWMIDGFPQVFVIDHEGVIRLYDVRNKLTLERKIEELLRVREAETPTKP